jgi:hypothetical protein
VCLKQETCRPCRSTALVCQEVACFRCPRNVHRHCLLPAVVCRTQTKLSVHVSVRLQPLFFFSGFNSASSAEIIIIESVMRPFVYCPHTCDTVKLLYCNWRLVIFTSFNRLYVAASYNIGYFSEIVGLPFC